MSSQATKLTPQSQEVPSPAPEHPTYHEQVAILAYQLWQERGSPEGSPEDDWFRAEQELQKTEA